MSRNCKDRTTALGKILTEIRTEAGLTIEQVSKKANISPTLVSGYERGTTDPRLSSLEKLLDTLGYEIEFLKK